MRRYMGPTVVEHVTKRPKHLDRVNPTIESV